MRPIPPGAPRRVSVLGSGLVGTSIALALRRHGIHVGLSDVDRDVVAEAVRLGAGVALAPGDPPADVVVVATPPSTVAGVLRDAQDRGLGAVYTDVASVKARILADAERAGCDLSRYVPGHPMAGGERAGPAAARAELFTGRAWALCPSPGTRPAAVRAVAGLVTACGAVPTTCPPDVHDRVVAAVSHVPHLVSAALAARFADADETVLSLAGQGLLDTTRIAGGPTKLWRDILEHNAAEVAAVLELVARDLAGAADTLRDPRRAESPALAELLARGNRGRRRITGAAGPTG